MPTDLYTNHVINFDTDFYKLDARNINIEPPKWNTECCIDRYIQQSELDRKMEELIIKIYRTIKDTARLDISEDDFMRLVKE